MPFKNDMSAMYVFHDALRRELECLSRVTARADDDPKHILRTAAGWEMFKSYLHVHHSVEDEMLWPPMRAALPADGDGAILLDAMEAEHAAIDPLPVAIDAALADRDSGPQQLGELVEEFATLLATHLHHEESEALALIDATLTEQQWQAFGAEGARRVAGDVQRALPWMLDGAAPAYSERLLGQLPPPVLRAYETEWQPAYEQLNRWSQKVPGALTTTEH